MSKLLRSPLSDDVFKGIFADHRHTADLAGLLRPLTGLPEKEFLRLSIVDPFLKRLFKSDKLGILDVKLLTTSNKVINVEVQVCRVPALRQRILYYLSKLLWEQLRQGEKYEKIQQVIGVIICDHIIADEPGSAPRFPQCLSEPGMAEPGEGSYLTSYTYRSDYNGKGFTDLIKIVTLELPKVPEEWDGSAAWPWARFFVCRKEEEYDMLVKEHPEVEGAVGKLKRMSLWDQVRMVMDEREIRRKDMMAIQDGLREEGFEKGLEEGMNRTRREEREQSHQEKVEAARNLLVHGVSPELIAGSLKLPPEEIAAL